MVCVHFGLLFVVFSVIIVIFLFALELLHFLDLVGHILFCFPLGGYTEQSVIDMLIKKILFCYEVSLDVLHQGRNPVHEHGCLLPRRFEDSFKML